MSHYTVLVVGGNPEKQLAPFQENNMGDCPAKYLEFSDCEDEYLVKYNTETSERVVMPDGKLLLPFDDKFRVKGKDLFESKHVVPENLERREIPFREIYPTFEKFMADYCGYKSRDKRKHRYGHWENPNAKWDGYQMGGRWTGFFTLKDNARGSVGQAGLMTKAASAGTADQARKGDIDFTRMRAEAGELAAKRWDDVASLLAVDGVIPPLALSWDQVLNDEKYKDMSLDEKRTVYHSQPELKNIERLRKDPATKNKAEKILGFFFDYEKYAVPREEFIKRAADGAICTFAVVMNGKWYERGEMGWWGCVGNEKDAGVWEAEFAKLLDSASDNTLLSVYDCHI